MDKKSNLEILIDRLYNDLSIFCNNIDIEVSWKQTIKHEEFSKIIKDGLLKLINNMNPEDTNNPIKNSQNIEFVNNIVLKFGYQQSSNQIYIWRKELSDIVDNNVLVLTNSVNDFTSKIWFEKDYPYKKLISKVIYGEINQNSYTLYISDRTTSSSENVVCFCPISIEILQNGFKLNHLLTFMNILTTPETCFHNYQNYLKLSESIYMLFKKLISHKEKVMYHEVVIDDHIYMCILRKKDILFNNGDILYEIN